jgi:CheY-like chemotaxis protein
MDLQMPRMDGIAATAAIRQLPGYAETPILALTANAFPRTASVAWRRA